MTPSTATSDPIRIRKALTAFDRRMNRLNRRQAGALGLWAAINLLTGAALTFTTEGLYPYVYSMNFCWGIANALIAAFLYGHNRRAASRPKTPLQLLDRQRHVEKMFMLNIGLDLMYVAAGVALWQRNLRPLPDYPFLWAGFGLSVMFQGACLLAHDAIFYRLHRLNYRRVQPVWEQLLGRVGVE